MRDYGHTEKLQQPHRISEKLMLLQDLLFRAAKNWPDKLAAVFTEHKITFSCLEQQSKQVATQLRDLGIGPGTRVAILSSNCLETLVYFWGILISGAKVIDIPALAGKDTIELILAESQPQALVIHPLQLAQMLTEKWCSCPEILFSFCDTKNNTVPQQADGKSIFLLQEVTKHVVETEQYPRTQASNIALIIYTSGTTGPPKGVMLSHNNLLSNAVAFNYMIKLNEQDSLLLIVPLYYIHGRIQLITHTMIGGTVFFSVGIESPKTVVQELAIYAPSGISGVPHHFSSLLLFGKLSHTALPHLQNITITGSALPETVLHQLQNAFPDTAIHINYSLTETSPRLTYHGPSEEVLLRPGSCGKAIPGVIINILDKNESPVPIGNIGEVVASGPGIMQGYISGNEHTSNTIDSKGRLRTGDLGYFDSHGYLFLCGRRPELIKSAGKRVSIQGVEQVLQRHPSVREAVVLSVPDKALGERLIAYVVPHQPHNLNFAEIKNHCLKFLPFVRTPKVVKFLPGIPKTSSGKIKRNILRQLYNSSSVN